MPHQRSGKHRGSGLLRTLPALAAALLCALLSHAQPAAALSSLQGAPVKLSSANQLLSLWTSGGAAVTAAEFPEATWGSRKRHWWEDTLDDDTQCEAPFARPARALNSTVHATACACAKSCRATDACSAWLWCADAGGCAVSGGRRLSQNSCILWHLDMLPQMQPDPEVPPDIAGLDMYNHTVGFLSGQLYRRPMGLHMLTVQQQCTKNSWASEETALADHLSRVSLTNKVNFARLHGASLEVVANPPSNKLAIIAAALERLTRTRAPQKWLLWMGTASMVANPVFNFPLRDYAVKGHDLVVGGNLQRVMTGDAWGFDSHIMLIHNTPWSRRFFQRAAQLFNSPEELRESIGVMAKFHNASAVEDRLVITHMLRHSADLREHVHFERTFCLSCSMNGLDLRMPTAFTTTLHGAPVCNEHSVGQDQLRNVDAVMRAEECSFVRTLEQSRPVLATQPGAALSIPGPMRVQDAVVLAGKDNRLPDIEACRAVCRENEECTAWLYCWHAGGCDDGIGFETSRYPDKACELLRLPLDVPMAHKHRPLAFSSSSMGFHNPDQFELEEEFRDEKSEGPEQLAASVEEMLDEESESLEQQEAPVQELPADGAPAPAPGPGDGPAPPKRRQTVALITAIPQSSCAHPAADALNIWSVTNKQDYAHLHGYEFHLSAHSIDPTRKGNFNKLMMLQKTLNDMPPSSTGGIEWLWWLDIDTVIDPAQVLPFDEFEGKDVVIWGHRAKVEAGDIAGLNFGVILLRNSDWTRQLLADMCDHARDEELESMRPELEKYVTVVPGFKDTPFLMWALKRTPGNLDRVYFEGDVERLHLGLNRHFPQVEWARGERPLVVHYAGCSYCARQRHVKMSDSVMGACVDEMAKALAFADCRLGHQHANSDAEACTYDGRDLSWVNTILSV